MASENEGYKGHRPGSSKEKVHKVFDEKGKDAAVKKAVSLEIKETTARTWCSSWGSGKSKKKKATKAPVKKAAAKTTKKKVKKAAAKKAPAKKAVKRERVEASAPAAA